jgi:malonyl-CoA O-methyltransferase
MTQRARAICSHFSRQAEQYQQHAGLQRAMAWRLAHRIATLPVPAGPMADLGAGSGLVGQALQQLAPQHQLLQLDGSAALLQHNPLAASTTERLVWDLNAGLPDCLQGSALLTSSFGLHWLSRPTEALKQWATALAPGGWLVVAVPVAGSFKQWHQAACRAEVPCTAWPLPAATELLQAVSSVLALKHHQEMQFSRRYGPGGRAFFRQLQQLGAGYSDHPPLRPSQWRQLLNHWPADEQVSWRILMLMAQRPAEQR